MTIVRRTQADVDLSKIGWTALQSTDDAEIAADPDTAPIFTAAELVRAARVVPPPVLDDISPSQQWCDRQQAR